uniref:Uncharacterized protein n=1 Tax=Arundo donax TaxID=35708 RepID=A0A0A9GJ01_ARUDO
MAGGVDVNVAITKGKEEGCLLRPCLFELLGTFRQLAFGISKSQMLSKVRS